MLRELETQGQGLDAQEPGLGSSRTETRASETITSFSVTSSGASKASKSSHKSQSEMKESHGVRGGGEGMSLRMEVEEEGANDTMGSGNTLDLIRDVQQVVQGEEDHTIMTISSLGTTTTHQLNLHPLNTHPYYTPLIYLSYPPNTLNMNSRM